MSSGISCLNTVVIDNGTGVCKAGIAGDIDPKVTLRTLTGRHPNENDVNSPYRPTTLCNRTNEIHVGEDITSHSGHLTRTYPVTRGVVTDWEHMERIWWYIYRQLNIEPADNPVLLTEPPFNPKSNRDKAAEVFFEKFRVPSFHITLDTILALHGTGRSSGVVVSCGEGVTSVAAIFDGYTFPRSVLRQDQAGCDVTVHLGQQLAERGHNLLASAAGREVLRSMKEKTAYVCPDPGRIIENSPDSMSYTLPDGRKVEVTEERYQCTETLFQPSARGLEWLSVPGLIHESVKHSEIDGRRDLLRNIILTGGTTKLPGMCTHKSQ